MESLEPFKEYIERFQQFSFSGFQDIYHGLYSDYADIQNRLEFSLLINPESELDLRFGLFKLYDPQKISSVFSKTGFEANALENILSSVRIFVPEFAVGFDFNKNETRSKLYLLRLPDSREFMRYPIKAINMVSELTGIDCTYLNEQEIRCCYLMAIDFHQMNVHNVKIYSRDESANLAKINAFLVEQGIVSRHLMIFQEIFSEGQLKDVTISRKYSRSQNSPAGLSVFFEVEDSLNGLIEQFVKVCVPEKFPDFVEAVRTLEWDKPVHYSHVGLTFSENMRKEDVCVYFSPAL